MEIKEDIDLEADFDAFIKLLEQGNLIEAIEKYYDDNIIQIENTNKPISGKAILKANEEVNLQNVNSINFQIKDFIIDQNKGLIWGEMIIRFSNKKNVKKVLSEAFKQYWNNGKIVRQQFFYRGVENDH